MKYPDPAKPLAEQDPDVLLGITILWEAGGEGPRGRAAVAHVVCNRMRQKGQSVAKVVLKKWAFSCYNANKKDGGRTLHELLHPVEHQGTGAWAGCLKTATEALAGASADPTNGATHYCVNELWACPVAVNKFKRRIPQWHDKVEIDSGRTTFCARIGGHTFARAPW